MRKEQAIKLHLRMIKKNSQKTICTMQEQINSTLKFA
jgi:hypothetical protein